MKCYFHNTRLLILYLVISCCILVSCGNISESNLSDSSINISDNLPSTFEEFNTDVNNVSETIISTNMDENTSDIQINTQSNAEKDNIMNKQLWKILIIREIPTSNYTQKITVVDESGTIYRDNYSDVNESFHIYEENWQEQLSDICNSSNTSERLSDDDIKIFAEYMENIYKYKEENVMTQKSQLKDYGVTVVYGIDYNNDNPEYTLICKYGSEISCIDNSITKKFANELIQLNLLYTMGYTFE